MYCPTWCELMPDLDKNGRLNSRMLTVRVNGCQTYRMCSIFQYVIVTLMSIHYKLKCYWTLLNHTLLCHKDMLIHWAHRLNKALVQACLCCGYGLEPIQAPSSSFSWQIHMAYIRTPIYIERNSCLGLCIWNRFRKLILVQLYNPVLRGCQLPSPPFKESQYE